MVHDRSKIDAHNTGESFAVIRSCTYLYHYHVLPTNTYTHIYTDTHQYVPYIHANVEGAADPDIVINVCEKIRFISFSYVKH